MLDRRDVLAGLGATAIGALLPLPDARPVAFFLFDDDELAAVARPWIDQSVRRLVEVDLREEGIDLGRVTMRDEIWLSCADDYEYRAMAMTLRRSLPREIDIVLCGFFRS